MTIGTAGAVEVSVQDCKTCHLDMYQKWDESAHSQKIECATCHSLVNGDYNDHIADPSKSVPEVDLSADSCGNCHVDIFDEWNEYGEGTFDVTIMASHSEPVIGVEPRLLEAGRSCVSCKSTDGGIFNIEEAGIYEFAEEELPEPEDVEEWRITCVACHEPHSTLLRMEDATLLCSNCHNSEGAVPDGETTIARHTQWEMYNDSVYSSGKHPGDIGCVDCHMAELPENESIQRNAVSGHSFKINTTVLSSPEAMNGCYECHGESLPALVEAKQEGISARLENLEQLQAEATRALESLNGTVEYEVQQGNYNNALFYISSVRNDGSLGIHNGESARNELNTAEGLFTEVIESEAKDEKAPGFEILTTLGILLSTYYLIKKE
ncbi:ammonia-forming cytochrome c nitrite reductase subunit c552 [Methanolobus sp. ZRKC3]|uniref:ammonia-forming cytochrome c nitrite reductase subunit c552 n=1 Tax=Methanolobus sp. ZRKC3 TaxID=3125786 RepID=UPI0032563CC2